MLSLVCLLATVFAPVLGTPSVWSCPFVPFGPMQSFDMRMAEDCPTSSFLHYYSCCDDNPFQCCFHFETWAIVIFAILCVGILAAILFISGKLLLRSKN